MEFINYAIVSLASFSGLFVGALLSFISPEEMKPGKKYFEIMIKVLFIILAGSIILFLGDHMILSIVTIAVSVWFIMKIPKKYIYPVLAVLFYMSSKDITLFPIAASAIFLIGLPKGTLYSCEQKKASKFDIIKNLLIDHLLFLVIALPLYFSNL